MTDENKVKLKAVRALADDVLEVYDTEHPCALGAMARALKHLADVIESEDKERSSK